MDFEVDMLKFWVEQLQEILPEPNDDQAEAQEIDPSETSFPRSR